MRGEHQRGRTARAPRVHESPGVRTPARRARAAAIATMLAAVAACDDGTSPTDPGPPTGEGAIRVTVTTSGATPDADGYVLSIGGLEEQAVSDGTIDVTDVPAGDRTVELTDLAPNCTVDGDNPRGVTVTGGETAVTAFTVECPRALLDTIVYQTTSPGNREIFAVPLDGGPVTNLSNHPGEDWFGVVSPDGTRILIDTQRDADREIYVVNADGTGLTNLTNRSISDEAVPDWSPDGSQILFETGRDGDLEIYAMNADGTGPHNLTNAPSSQERFASWSPVGERILFTTNRDGNNEIYSMAPDGSDVTNLTNHPAEDFYGVSSPDGSRVAFTRDVGTNTEVFVMNADGSGQTNLTNHPAADELPDWSPDGNRLVFASTRSGSVDVWTMNADGSNLENVTDNPAVLDGAPTWSP